MEVCLSSTSFKFCALGFIDVVVLMGSERVSNLEDLLAVNFCSVLVNGLLCALDTVDLSTSFCLGVMVDPEGFELCFLEVAVFVSVSCE